MDSISKNALTSFEKLFIIQGLIKGEYLSLLYCFIKKKDKVLYNRLFNCIKTDGKVDFAIKYVIDFEKAIYKSLTSMFENVKVNSYNFHSGQII